MAQTCSQAPTLVIKRIKKVAYADFVNAMMAFFPLLWLLSTTTDEQKAGISEYFTFATVSQSTSGVRGVLGGQSLSSELGANDAKPAVTLAMASPKTTPPAPKTDAESPAESGGHEVATQLGANKITGSLSEQALDQAITDRERKEFGKADTEPLFPDDPFLPGNRRISITLMREAPALAPKALRIN